MKNVSLPLITIIMICMIMTGCSSNKEPPATVSSNVTPTEFLTKEASNSNSDTTADVTITPNEDEAIIQPEENYMGSYVTKEYRNVFKECGYSDEEIKIKIDRAWNSLFYGDENTKIYYDNKDEAYILDTGNGDVRSEGMSYGMMMCVQMDKQEEFDKLWKWAKTHMQVPNGPNEGYFLWSMNTDGSPHSNGPAPDGEEYFAMSLLFASNRWGDKEAPFDYSNQARYILRQMLHQEDDGSGDNMFDIEKKLIKFVPNSRFTDPSYHLPHFYELFALWADEEDRDFWKGAAAASREYLKLACHPETGLASDYATYEGVPVSNNGGHDLFSSDAFRVAGNIGLDYLWFAADPWEQEQSNRIQAFFVKEGLGRYYSKYTLEGTAQPDANYQALALVGMNAMASLASNTSNTKAMVQDLWTRNPATGVWRYYDDCLYFFSMLALSGNYRIWD